MLGTEVHARIDPEIENRANAVFAGHGISPSTAVQAFFTVVAETGILPFDLNIPNAETAQAIRDGRAGIGLRSFGDTSSMFAALDSESDDDE